MEEARAEQQRRPAKKERDLCQTIARELANKGRVVLRRQGEEVTPAKKATAEENRAACHAYLDHCLKIAEEERSEPRRQKRAKSPRQRRAATAAASAPAPE